MCQAEHDVKACLVMAMQQAMPFPGARWSKLTPIQAKEDKPIRQPLQEFELKPSLQLADWCGAMMAPAQPLLPQNKIVTPSKAPWNLGTPQVCSTDRPWSPTLSFNGHHMPGCGISSILVMVDISLQFCRCKLHLSLLSLHAKGQL